jgi:hypothetical protein
MSLCFSGPQARDQGHQQLQILRCVCFANLLRMTGFFSHGDLIDAGLI